MLKKIFKYIYHPGIISKKYISKFLSDNPIILEAGADTGSDTIEMANLWPKATIYAFEPIRESFEKLKLNTSEYKNIHCHNLALDSENSEKQMFVSNTLSSSSLLKPKEHLNQHPEITFDIKQTVSTVTIENWMKSEGVSEIDFLWLDLQGLELSVLKKSINILQRVKVIYTEVSLIENYEGQSLYKELKDFLINNGFTIAKEELPWEDMGNVLFIRK